MAARSFRPKFSAVTAAAPRLTRLKKRADFLAAARGIRKVAGALTLELAPTPETIRAEQDLRVGFTASRKIGNAVARNRASPAQKAENRPGAAHEAHLSAEQDRA